MKSNSNDFLPKNYQTEEEKIELEEEKLQEKLDYLKEQKIKAEEKIN
jgi:hypothetical protein